MLRERNHFHGFVQKYCLFCSKKLVEECAIFGGIFTILWNLAWIILGLSYIHNIKINTLHESKALSNGPTCLYWYTLTQLPFKGFLLFFHFEKGRFGWIIHKPNLDFFAAKHLAERTNFCQNHVIFFSLQLLYYCG